MSNLISFEQSRFLKGQLLTEGDLNALWNFLEPQDRYTRISLTGAGIFYGLQLRSYDAAEMKIIVTKGAGVSSEGHLFFLEQDQPFILENHYTDTSKGGGQDNRFNLKTLNPAINEEKVDAWEFSTLSTDQNQRNPLKNSPKDFGQYCFVLYFKPVTTAGDTSCFSSFNQKGLRTIYNLKLLALPEAAIAKIWLTVAPGGGGSTPTAPQFPYIKRLPVWNLIKDKQPIPGKIGMKQNVTWEELCKAYEELCNAAIGSDNDGTVAGAIKEVLKNDFDATLNDLITLFVNDKKFQLQYLHDYLKDLVAAYEEWAVARPEVHTEVWCPNMAEFPKFVALGKTNSDDSADSPKGCRMPRYYPGIPGDLNLPQTDPLFERLKFMATVANLDFFSLNANSEVKITGSRRKCPPLSEQAIPFYYKNNTALRLLWNPAMTAAGRTDAIPSYYPHPSPTEKPFDQPLCYDLEQYDFYRVEGHIGKSLTEGFTAICNLRNELNLPFNIVLVRVGATVDYNNLTDDPKIEEAINDMNFTQFALNHPGMEHMGGVPRGGTLVLIFREDTFKTGEIREVRNEKKALLYYSLRRPDLPRTIVADFCLPYSCFKGPNIDFIFKEITGEPDPMSDFEVRDISYYKDDNNISFATVELENRSQFADEFKWFIDIIDDNGDYKRVDLNNDGVSNDEDFLDEPNILRYAFNLAEAQKIQVRLHAIKTGHSEDTSEQVIELCPTKMSLTLFDPTLDRQVEELAMELPTDDTATVVMSFSPPGGILKASDANLETLIVRENSDAKITLNSQIEPGTYIFRYYFCSGQERQVRLNLTKTQLIREGGSITRSAFPDTGRVKLLANIKEVSDNTLKDTRSYKRAVDFLTSSYLSVEDVTKEFEGLARLLLGTIGNPGGATDEQYATLLRNAIWGMLNKVVALHPGSMPETLHKSLTTLVPKLQEKGIDVNALREGWNSEDIRTNDNTDIIKGIETILKN
jgi:hypothetical protein